MIAGRKERTIELGEILYLVAFALWLSIALIRYTYFADFLPVKPILQTVCCVVQLLLLIKFTKEFEFSWKQVAGLFLLLIFMTIAWASGNLQFATMFALIYFAKNVPFEKILKVSLVMQILVFTITVFASQVGILEDVIWHDTGRQRHGLGFTHCMLAAHFGLYISLVYIGIVKKMTFLRAVAILIFNGILYYFAVGRTDFYLCLLFVPMAFVVQKLAGRLKGEKILGILLAAVPFVLFAVSVLVTAQYGENTEFILGLNQKLNGRLYLGYEALKNYGLPLWGRKIKWIGASVLYYDPAAKYNYVDNSYLMMSLSYGVVFVLGYCASMGYVLYKKALQKEWMLVLCLMVILAFGMINPQSMYLTYNPFLVLLAMAWNPQAKKEAVV